MASWEIFCSVVDNYGDIGVTWRLARQLAAEHGQAVRLWVDEPQAFARICPRADPAAHAVPGWGRSACLGPTVGTGGGRRCGDRGLRLRTAGGAPAGHARARGRPCG